MDTYIICLDHTMGAGKVNTIPKQFADFFFASLFLPRGLFHPGSWVKVMPVEKWRPGHPVPLLTEPPRLNEKNSFLGSADHQSHGISWYSSFYYCSVLICGSVAHILSHFYPKGTKNGNASYYFHSHSLLTCVICPCSLPRYALP